MAENNQSKADLEPEAETLKPRDDQVSVETKPADQATSRHKLEQGEANRRRFTYRPSHRATFIGLGVVIVILAVNAVVLGFLLKGAPSQNNSLANRGVSISPGVLSKLGVNDTQIGNTNETLVVDPAAQFNSKLSVAGNVSISGQLNLNSTLNASSASLNQLKTGSVTVNQISINGSATASSLSVTGNLGVAGTSHFQNSVQVDQLLSVSNSAAIANNLSVGNEITARNISTNNLSIAGTVIFGSHMITSGTTPSVGPGGPALGGQGSVSINGDDAAGTISVNIGAGAPSGGNLVNLSFANQYSGVPRVVITAIGCPATFYLTSVTTSGFSVAVSSALSPTHFYIDYIVEQ